ncbi:hypothetical protein SAMN05443668_12453 [Cryptosporangium aurantiacum]|uniref:Uncharacterized protein n=1 Tax=Cryptosporangium aurantiacum TaxID=134849 RepID=A0A1M7RMD5_9ACTN|nr:hypothetical protein SAMN05443668_12453 [Cryptosporangium aurantiacum]
MSRSDPTWMVLGPLLWFAGPILVGMLLFGLVTAVKRFRRR